MPTPSQSTADRKAKFVANLRRHMEARGFSIVETARRANLKDKKRFYRWASSGISRAAHDHHDDLDRLRRLFRLKSVEQLWSDAPEATLEDLLLSSAGGNPDHGYAYKLLVVLKAMTVERGDALRAVIDDAFDEATRETQAEDILRVLTPRQIIERLQQRSPKAYANLLKAAGGEVEDLVTFISTWLIHQPLDPVGKLAKKWERPSPA